MKRHAFVWCAILGCCAALVTGCGLLIKAAELRPAWHETLLSNPVWSPDGTHLYALQLRQQVKYQMVSLGLEDKGGTLCVVSRNMPPSAYTLFEFSSRSLDGGRHVTPRVAAEWEWKIDDNTGALSRPLLAVDPHTNMLWASNLHRAASIDLTTFSVHMERSAPPGLFSERFSVGEDGTRYSLDRQVRLETDSKGESFRVMDASGRLVRRIVFEREGFEARPIAPHFSFSPDNAWLTVRVSKKYSVEGVERGQQLVVFNLKTGKKRVLRDIP